MTVRTIYWQDGAIRLIDQTLLPEEFREIEIRDVKDLWEAIRSLRVRGAPAIGIAAAFGVVLGIPDRDEDYSGDLFHHVDGVCRHLATARPTAVNLFWALERMKNVARANRGHPIKEIRASLLLEAEKILEEDIAACRKMGEYGASLLRDGETVLTHCNAGGLATGGFGTAVGVIYSAVEAGKKIRVYADETRPLLQGSRLTAWELMENGIDVTLICDNMAAHVMRDKGVHAVIVGADRIASNGDFANKIGTYGLAVLAKEHGIPFYTVAPLSTIDREIRSGDEIPIEERDGAEITHGFGKRTAPEGVSVYNPAFDVTPARYLAAIVTEKGIARLPFEESIPKLFV